MLATSYRDITAHLQLKLVGQPRAIEQLGRAAKIIQAGLRDEDKPLAILLFAGPTGVGKSQAVIEFARALHPGEEFEEDKFICRVDCNLLGEAHSSSSLSGSPPGYVGSQEGDSVLVAKVIAGKPGYPGVLVFEEIEKAHMNVFDTLLGIFDKGKLRKNNGKGIIDFRNTVIILTSNLGARELSQAASGSKIGFTSPATEGQPVVLSGEQRRGIVFREMERVFKPEFINRLDDTVIFRWLDRNDASLIAEKFLEELNQKLYKFPHYLNYDASVIDLLLLHGFNIANGARQLKKAVRKFLEDPLSEVLADGTPFDNCSIQATCRSGDDHLSFHYEPLMVLEVPVALVPVAEPFLDPPAHPQAPSATESERPPAPEPEPAPAPIAPAATPPAAPPPAPLEDPPQAA